MGTALESANFVVGEKSTRPRTYDNTPGIVWCRGMLCGPTTANPARALLAPHKAVSQPVRVSEESRDCPRRVDAVGEGAFKKACAGARSINGCDSAVGGAQEAVKYEAGVKVSSRNRLLCLSKTTIYVRGWDLYFFVIFSRHARFCHAACHSVLDRSFTRCP